MPRFSANLSFLYKEYDFLDRFQAAANDGFGSVEYLFPYEFEISELTKVLGKANIKQSLFNAPPGNWLAGERGIASLPDRSSEFKKGFELALKYAHELDCKKIHVMAGITPKDQIDNQEYLELMQATYISNLKFATEKASPLGISIQIEPINHRDMPNYFLNKLAHAKNVICKVAAPNIKIQFDCYHVQITEGDLTRNLERFIGDIGHIQIAGVPTRNEPNLGEINYPHLFKTLDNLNYTGEIGCEYNPKAGTSAGLEWLKPYL